jgi:hypothetical protein
MNESERHAVEDVRVLWPYLTPLERTEWTLRLKYLFHDKFFTTVSVLSSRRDIPTETWRHSDGTVRVDHLDAREGDYYG